MSIINVDNVKMDGYLDDKRPASNVDEKEVIKIDSTKIKQLKKDSKKKYTELLQLVGKLYKFQSNKEIGDNFITLELLKNKFNLN
jgi:hypothetical protein